MVDYHLIKVSIFLLAAFIFENSSFQYRNSIKVSHDAVSATYKMKGAFDKENALCYALSSGLIKHANNRSCLSPFSQNGHPEVTARGKACAVFISSTNGTFCNGVLEHKAFVKAVRPIIQASYFIPIAIPIKAMFKGQVPITLNDKIRVQPVFYRDFWLIIILVVVILFAGFFIIYQRREHKRFQVKSLKLIDTLEHQSLIAQMNPHFLHNTISNIQGVLLSGDRRLVNKYFEGFLVVLRYTLKMSKINRVDLNEEVEYLESYLLISKMRLNDELVYHIDVDPELSMRPVKIPSLIVQPIVENAIIHGLKPKIGEKKLQVTFKKEAQLVVVEITDNGIGRAEAKQIKNNSVVKMESLNSKILEKRLALINQDSEEISIVYKDLSPVHQESFGTKVIITFSNLL